MVLALRSGCRTYRVRLGPLKGVVCYLLPAVLSYGVVGAPWELLVVCYGLGVAVVLDVRLVDRGWHEVVIASRYEQQRRPILIPEVDVGVLVARGEVGRDPAPHEIARRGNVVAFVDFLRLLLREGVGEGVVELLGVNPTALWRSAGCLRIGKRDLICETGTTLMPSAGTESIATPAAP